MSHTVYGLADKLDRAQVRALARRVIGGKLSWLDAQSRLDDWILAATLPSFSAANGNAQTKRVPVVDSVKLVAATVSPHNSEASNSNNTMACIRAPNTVSALIAAFMRRISSPESPFALRGGLAVRGAMIQLLARGARAGVLQESACHGKKLSVCQK